MKSRTYPDIRWPKGKSFAFSIFDDTDLARIENVKPVYELLTELGIRTTKSVWPITVGEPPAVGGSTCEDAEYLDFVLDLQASGFEIGYHLASYNSSTRADTHRALDAFQSHFGHFPRSMTSHDSNQDGMYWGAARFNGASRMAYNLLTRFKKSNYFRGHIEGNPFFWGDLCRDRIDYVRNFVFREVNTLAKCPNMPYHDPDRPYVKKWFASTDGFDVSTFCNALSEKNIDRLVDEGGACIMYTHFGCSFVKDGVLNARFKEIMTYLSKKNGWFVPVSTLLDFLGERNNNHTLSASERTKLEFNWLWNRMRNKNISSSI